MTHSAENDAASRAALIEDYASFWWAQETGETDEWADLNAKEREAVVENSYAETVADWFIDSLATSVTPPARCKVDGGRPCIACPDGCTGEARVIPPEKGQP